MLGLIEKGPSRRGGGSLFLLLLFPFASRAQASAFTRGCPVSRGEFVLGPAPYAHSVAEVRAVGPTSPQPAPPQPRVSMGPLLAQ